jgi:tetratricopeptide (TPR) repeat protein
VPCAAQPAPESAQPVDSDALIGEALAEVRAGRTDAAIALLETIDLEAAGDPRLRAVLGALYVEGGRPAEALEVLADLAERENADVAVLYNAGRAAAALGELERAQRYLEGSVAAFPQSPAARELGLLHLRQGRFMPAYLQLRPWSARNPGDSEAVLGAARCAVVLGRGGEAEELLELLPDDDPAVKLLWANALLLEEDAWSALALAQELADDPPEASEPQILTLLADVYFAIGEPSLVVEALQGKTARRPLVAVRLARAYRLEGRLDEAQELLEPFSRGLVEDDPEVGGWLPGLGAEVALEYGRLLAATERHDEALAFFRASTDRSPQDVDAWRALAASLEAIGDTEAAGEATRRADELNRVAGNDAALESEGVNLGADPTARQLRRAQALLDLGASEDGLRIARQERILVPGDPRPPLVEALMLMRLDRPAEALETMEGAAAAFPESSDVHYYHGVVLMALDRLEDAEQALDRALELSPEHTPALTDLALLLAAQDRDDEVRELAQRILQLSPGDATATRLLEQL